MENLGRWERHYIRTARRGFVWIPLSSKSACCLIEQGLIEGFGMVSGRRAEYRLTDEGKKLNASLKAA